MVKRFLILLFSTMLLVCFVSCTNSLLLSDKNTSDMQTETTVATTETEQVSVRSNNTSKVRLIVNGVDITAGNYVVINHDSKNAELPMLAILRALGHDAELRYNAEQDVYESVIDNNSGFFTTAYDDFSIGVDYGDPTCVRKIKNNDFIIDSNCAFTPMFWSWEARIAVDYESSTIYVDSCDPWEEAEGLPLTGF